MSMSYELSTNTLLPTDIIPWSTGNVLKKFYCMKIKY